MGKPPSAGGLARAIAACASSPLRWFRRTLSTWWRRREHADRRGLIVLLGLSVIIALVALGLAERYQAVVQQVCEDDPCLDGCRTLVRQEGGCVDRCVERRDVVRRFEDALRLRPDEQICAFDSPSFTNALFYSIQTVTTTGYGSAIVVDSHRIQQWSIIGMLVGAALWSALIGQAVALMITWSGRTKKSAPGNDAATRNESPN